MFCALLRKAQWKYVLLAGLAVVVRPTAAIMWTPMCLWHLYMYRHVLWKVARLFAEKGLVIIYCVVLTNACSTRNSDCYSTYFGILFN